MNLNHLILYYVCNILKYAKLFWCYHDPICNDLIEWYQNHFFEKLKKE
jgi:hypothetical protein